MEWRLAMLNFQHFEVAVPAFGYRPLGKMTLSRVPMSKSLAWTVWAVTALLLGCFFVWPILTTVQRAFFDPSGNFSLLAIREVFANRIYVEGLRNSFMLALASTALTLVIALPLAFLSDRFDFRGKVRITWLGRVGDFFGFG